MRARKRPAAGFTLIELVIVMVIIAVGLLGMTSLFSNTSTSLSTNETLQQVTQYAQECAEKAIATRRNLGFASASINSTMCDSLVLPSGFTRTVGGTTAVDGTGSPCPSGIANCKNVLVTVTNGALSSSITVMLVNY